MEYLSKINGRGGIRVQVFIFKLVIVRLESKGKEKKVFEI